MPTPFPPSADLNAQRSLAVATLVALLSLTSGCGGGGDNVGSDRATTAPSSPVAMALQSTASAQVDANFCSASAVNTGPYQWVDGQCTLVSALPSASATSRAKASATSVRATPSATATVDATALFDWAEVQYPNLFPSHQANLFTERFAYRYYPETQTALGVSEGKVYGLGPFTGNVLALLGNLSDFTCQVSPALCAAPSGVTISSGPSTTTEPFAIFHFSAQGAASFECALDNESFSPCVSPLQLPRPNAKAQYERLAVGSHTLRVRALNSNATPGESVSKTWSVDSIFASGSADFAAKRLIDGQVMPVAATTGGWKGIMRINCEFDQASYDDPVRYPGVAAGGVLSMFYGHKNVDRLTNHETLLNSDEAGCSGSTLNRSAYWMPALLAPKYNTSTGARVLDAAGAPAWDVVKAKVGEGDRSAAAAHEVFYYSAAVSDVNSIWTPPMGLRIVAGNALGTPSTAAQSTSIARWHCQSWNASDAAGGPFSSTIPECLAPDMLRFDVFFPSCWNGKDLDSADHQSHMAYPSGTANQVQCPTTHPYPIVRLSYHFAFPLFPGQLDPQTKTSKGFRLASDLYTVDAGQKGGLSLHGVWMNGWHPEAMDLLLKGCVRGQRDCHDGNFAVTSATSGTSGAWSGSLSLGGLEAAKGTETIPAIINQGRGSH